MDESQGRIVFFFKEVIFVYNGDVLSSRVKMLRTTYGLTQVRLSHLTSLAVPIGAAAIGYWEIQKRIPTVAALQSVADLFAVSLDWISGRREKPYDESLILLLERALLPLVIPFSEKENFIALPCFEIQIPEEYQNEEKRPIYYPLGVRANIIFWLNCFKYDIINRSLIIKHPTSDGEKLTLQLSELNQELMIQYNELFNNNSRLGLPASMVADVPAPQPIWDLEEVCRAKNI